MTTHILSILSILDSPSLFVFLSAVTVIIVAGVAIWLSWRDGNDDGDHVTRDCGCLRCEAMRFRERPRVGDRAGFLTLDGKWTVGEVDQVEWIDDNDNDDAGADSVRVQLAFPISTPFGASSARTWMNVADINLRWFPPDTPLGVQRREGSDRKGENPNV